MNFQDKILKCRDCSAEFLFSAGEQEFFHSKGYINEPRRCLACRTAFRNAQAAANVTKRERAPREMHIITCAQCGQQAQVPFLPRLDRPVYCSHCFESVATARQNETTAL